MLKDLRLAARMLWQAKGWTAVVVLSLALGIGANTALFSAYNNLLLKKLAVDEPDTLVRLRHSGPNDMRTGSSDYGVSPPAAGMETRATFSYPIYQQLIASNKTMTGLAAGAPLFGRANVVVDGHADMASAFVASGNYFHLLGVGANPGRVLMPDDDEAARPPVAVISRRFWQSRFGSVTSVVGRTMTVNNVPVTIVGVVEPSFSGIQLVTQEPPDITLPLTLYPRLYPDDLRMAQATNWWLMVVGRLQPGVTAEQVRGNLEGVFREAARAGMTSYLAAASEQERSTAVNRNRKAIPSLVVDSANRGIYDPPRTEVQSVTVLSGVVVLVLLIVCANVANLLLSRAAGRQTEVAVRLSLGATRLRLVRQLLTESLLLASIGGVLGVLVGKWSQRLLPGTAGMATDLDWRSLSFAAGVSLLTALLFGMAPALRATRTSIRHALNETSRSVVMSRTLIGKSLVVVQVAISLVLLVGAGLFLRTFQNLRQTDVGFNTDNLMVFGVSPQLIGYDTPRMMALYQQMMERLATVPGVRAAALSQPGLLSGGRNSTRVFVEGRTYTQGTETSLHRLQVSPSFFETMEMPLLLGRRFTDRDTDAAPRVAILNETAAKRLFPNQNPLGQRFGTTAETSGQLEVIGVLRDAKYDSVRDEAPATMYVPHTQGRTNNPVFAVRTAGAPSGVVASVREAIRQIDPNLPMINVSTQNDQLEIRLVQEKLFARAYTFFGGLALLIASVGLFGLMSYTVARRRNEIGIRMALGAERGDVLRQVLRESMVLVACGIVLGIGVALAASRFVASLLFGLAATDATTMIVATFVMIAVSAIAGFLPARQASRVDPMVALRYE